MLAGPTFMLLNIVPGPETWALHKLAAPMDAVRSSNAAWPTPRGPMCAPRRALPNFGCIAIEKYSHRSRSDLNCIFQFSEVKFSRCRYSSVARFDNADLYIYFLSCPSSDRYPISKIIGSYCDLESITTVCISSTIRHHSIRIDHTASHEYAAAEGKALLLSISFVCDRRNLFPP